MSSAKDCPRHVFIDQMLYFTGRLSRSDLVSVFGVGVATASRDISSFLGTLQDSSCVLGRGREGYWASEEYSPKFDHNPEVILDLLTSSLVQQWVDRPNFGYTQPMSYPALDADVIAPITRALSLKEPVRLLYQTAGRNGLERIVIPVALFAASGFRYVRVYEIDRHRFITLKLTRVISSKLEKLPQPIHLSVDEEWSKEIILTIGAHPNHSSKESVERDHDLPRGGVKNFSVISGFAGYLLAEWRVDCSGAGLLEPIQYPFALINRQELQDVPSLTIAPGYEVTDFNFTVVLCGVDKITSHLEDRVFQSGCNDGVLSESNGVVSLKFKRKHFSFDQAVASVLRQLSVNGLNELKVIFEK
ncbi:WYL domain-containing protein [uncultured Endozoicomonas sp.]|uniref:WYL domain-containing protein n=1 Tax=uncultured Endozoicomonas sp. TaxID=432652 RepID=UPI00260EF417|nr:WYL domain-containing protein [uncultured Endozoicomonas sp.]